MPRCGWFFDGMGRNKVGKRGDVGTTAALSPNGNGSCSASGLKEPAPLSERQYHEACSRDHDCLRWEFRNIHTDRRANWRIVDCIEVAAHAVDVARVDGAGLIRNGGGIIGG